MLTVVILLLLRAMFGADPVYFSTDVAILCVMELCSQLLQDGLVYALILFKYTAPFTSDDEAAYAEMPVGSLLVGYRFTDGKPTRAYSKLQAPFFDGLGLAVFVLEPGCLGWLPSIDGVTGLTAGLAY